jgi:hypothetical protein
VRGVGQPSDQATEVGRERRRPPRASGHVATKALENEASQTQSHARTRRPETILFSRSRTSHPKTHSRARPGLSGRRRRTPTSIIGRLRPSPPHRRASHPVQTHQPATTPSSAKSPISRLQAEQGRFMPPTKLHRNLSVLEGYLTRRNFTLKRTGTDDRLRLA